MEEKVLNETVRKQYVNRALEWSDFSYQVSKHILEYTIPQYGNPEGDDQVTSFTVEDCFTNMMRYTNRRKSNTRGNKEKLRDLIKIAHYAQLAHDKLKLELQEPNVY
jgi:hypothetical protein